MSNEYMISPNSEEIEWLIYQFLFALINNNAFEFVNILMSWNNANQALMSLNIIEYKSQLIEFVISHKTFLNTCPFFGYMSFFWILVLFWIRQYFTK